MELPKKKEYSKEDGMGYLYYQSDKEYTNAWNDCHKQYTKAIIERLEKTKKEFMGLPSVYVCDIDQLIKELKDE